MALEWSARALFSVKIYRKRLESPINTRFLQLFVDPIMALYPSFME
nr:MAG TPA: hypothetical protein [Caudoviricetes sp.]DAY17201.1 MAG TPA: hypothetical protein [Caudoviricetes sp.]